MHLSSSTLQLVWGLGRHQIVIELLPLLIFPTQASEPESDVQIGSLVGVPPTQQPLIGLGLLTH